MTELPMIEILGHWLAIFLTFCILSFLYKDNPFYKLSEHLFIGVSIGYVVTQQYYNVLRPKLVERLAEAEHWYWNWDLVILALTLCMFIKAISKRWAWVGRYPLAFVVALYAGLQVNAVAQSDLGQQIKRATQTMDAQKVNINTTDPKTLLSLPGMSPSIARAIIKQREQAPITHLDDLYKITDLKTGEIETLVDARGHFIGLDARASVRDGDRWWFGIFSNVLLFLGLLASLVYFYFSLAHTGAVGKVSRFGVWILMIGFGASFGYTVMGRLALAIGRAQYVLGLKEDEAARVQIKGWLVALVSIAIIVIGLIVWEARQKRLESEATDE